MNLIVNHNITTIFVKTIIICHIIYCHSLLIRFNDFILILLQLLFSQKYRNCIWSLFLFLPYCLPLFLCFTKLQPYRYFSVSIILSSFLMWAFLEMSTEDLQMPDSFLSFRSERKATSSEMPPCCYLCCLFMCPAFVSTYTGWENICNSYIW